MPGGLQIDERPEPRRVGTDETEVDQQVSEQARAGQSCVPAPDHGGR
jgi:hypothetical protein